MREPCPEQEIKFYRMTLNIDPFFYEAGKNLIEALLENKTDVSYWHDAETICCNLIAKHCNNADLYYLYSKIKKRFSDYDGAIKLLEKTIKLNPRLILAYFSMAEIYYEIGNFDKTTLYYKKVLQFDPDHVKSKINLGVVYTNIGRHDLAIDLYKKALAQEPDNAEAHNNLGYSYLREGNLVQGWLEREWRLNLKNIDTIRNAAINEEILKLIPLWRGESIKNKTILVHGEQGLGDEIMYASCITDLMRNAKHVIIQCDVRLESIYKRSFPGAMVYGGRRDESPQWLDRFQQPDYQCPIETICRYFRLKESDFPDHNQFLTADLEKRSYWKKILSDINNKPKVGIVWRSGLQSYLRNKNYYSIEEWLTILSNDNIQFINLVYDDCRDELDWLYLEHKINVIELAGLDLKNDLENTAAVMKELDLVISISSAPRHLAAAVGASVWSVDAHYSKTRMLFYPDSFSIINSADKNKIGNIEKINEYLKIWYELRNKINIEKESKNIDKTLINVNNFNMLIEYDRLSFQTHCYNRLMNNKSYINTIFYGFSLSKINYLLNTNSIHKKFIIRFSKNIKYFEDFKKLLDIIEDLNIKLVFEYEIFSRIFELESTLKKSGWATFHQKNNCKYQQYREVVPSNLLIAEKFNSNYSGSPNCAMLAT